jgi:hypothetical protein
VKKYVIRRRHGEDDEERKGRRGQTVGQVGVGVTLFSIYIRACSALIYACSHKLAFQ